MATANMVRLSAGVVHWHADRGVELAAHAEGVEEGTHMGQEKSSVDAGRAASVEVVQALHTEPCAACDVGLEDMNSRRKNCCGCSHPGCGIADHEASCNHILADQAAAESVLSSRYRLRDVSDAVCVSGGARLGAAPPVEVSRGDLSFLLTPRSADGFGVVCAVLSGRDGRRARSPAVLLGTAAVRRDHLAERNHSDWRSKCAPPSSGGISRQVTLVRRLRLPLRHLVRVAFRVVAAGLC